MGTDTAHLDALYPAIAAVVVAGLGVIGTVIDRRRNRGTGDEDLVTALAEALAAETAARKAAEARAVACEAREEARRQRRG